MKFIEVSALMNLNKLIIFRIHKVIRSITLLFIYLISMPFLFGQQDHNFDTGKKLNINLAYGITYGVQGVAIPPFVSKLLVGIEYTVGKGAVYAFPGITAGMIPVVLFHFETGIRYHFMTIDYSTTNSYKILDDESVREFSNTNINLGVRIKLNKNKEDDLSLWIKGGKSISEKAYDEEFPPIWNGYHAEIRLVYKVPRVSKK